MAIPLPTFNIVVNIWRFGTPTTDPPDLADVPANLAWGKRVNQAGGESDDGFTMTLLVPAGTDIRGEWNTGGSPDTVEASAGDGWYYEVLYVDRSGHEFPNAHLNAVIRLYYGNSPPVPPVADGFITEGGDPLVSESGDRFIPE